MNQIYNSDKPINQKLQDKFNRQKFSTRIAETIIKRQVEDGLVLGLYGIWGEGKSSVLNMIEEELIKFSDILIVKFNPWRFKDEDTLILNYFKNISVALDRELNNKKEKVGKFLNKYGSIGSVFNLDLTKLGESLFDADIEQLKERVNDFLRECNKKVVVIIDDIDRLDKLELFALFKLIKLTGDFSHTYYLLSFDDEMVASAIGERFSDGNSEAGHSFLEKIIQVPIRIPKAMSQDILKYCLELINEVLTLNEVDLGTESTDVGYQISRNLITRVNTPRLAIRYANSLSFLIPLLNGEVNIGDLILFEGVKLFYPDHYNFISTSPEYFIEPYENSYSRESNNKKKEELVEKFDQLSKGLTKKENEAILDLLKYLFPLIRDAFGGYSFLHRDKNWAKEKRIVSPKYFNRYFLYSVPGDDISDVFFHEYLRGLTNKSVEDVLSETLKLFEDIEASEFVNKISAYETELNWDQKKIVISVLCKLQDKFEGLKGGTFMLGFDQKSQVAIIITKLLEGQNDNSERYQFTESLVKCTDFMFALEIVRWLKVANKRGELGTEDIQRLEEAILARALSDLEQNGGNLFQRYSSCIFRLLEIWYRRSPIQLKKYIDKCVKDEKDFQEIIIEEMTSTIYSSSYLEPYKTDFKKESYEVLKKYYDVDKLFKKFSKRKYDKLKNIPVRFFDTDKGSTVENAIRQFLYWYEEDKIADFNLNS